MELELSPIFSSSRVTAKPSAPARTTKALARSSSRAKTMKVEACEPLVIHCLEPVMRLSTARVRMAHASDPEPASVSAKAPSSSPGGQRGHVRGAVGEQRQRAGAGVDGHGHPDAGVGARELLEHEHVGEEVGARAAVLLGHADAHQAELAELGEQLAREDVVAIPLRRVRGDLLVGEPAREVADLLLLVRQLAHARARVTATPPPTAAAATAAPAKRSRRRSKRRISQPSSRATRASVLSGCTATGWPTARSIGRSDSESEYAHEAARSMSSRSASSRIACALPSR